MCAIGCTLTVCAKLLVSLWNFLLLPVIAGNAPKRNFKYDNSSPVEVLHGHCKALEVDEL